MSFLVQLLPSRCGGKVPRLRTLPHASNPQRVSNSNRILTPRLVRPGLTSVSPVCGALNCRRLSAGRLFLVGL